MSHFDNVQVRAHKSMLAPPDKHRPLCPLHMHLRPIGMSLLICLVLFTGIVSGWPVALPLIQAAQLASPQQATMTLAQFLKQGPADQAFHGPFQLSNLTPPGGVRKTAGDQMQPATLPHSAEPVTMQTLTASLDPSFLATSGVVSQASAAPLDLKGSDGRLEVLIPRGSLDLSHASILGTRSPSGTLTLTITQLHGLVIGQSITLGQYRFQVLDSQGHEVSGIRLTHPATFLFHYQPAILDAANLSPDELTLSWPDLLDKARAAHQPTGELEVALTNHPATRTLSAPLPFLATGNATTSGDPAVQPPPTPHLASVSGNAGQASLSYPLQVPPGPGGFAPKLQLTYSSQSTNERQSNSSPAGWVGDGWSLQLASITAEKFPDTSAGGAQQWFSISGVDGISDRLIPEAGTGSSGFYQTQHISHLRIFHTGSCWQVWDLSGTYYEFGCTSDSKQFSVDSSGSKTNYRFDLDRMVAPSDSTGNFKTMLVTYEQDSYDDPSGHTDIRDAAVKQITYGVSSSFSLSSSSSLDVLVAGTVDFHYLAPNSDGSWASKYGTNHNCSSNPPTNTTWRCDDPVKRGTVNAPNVQSTLTLDSLTSYVGTDANDQVNSFIAFKYSFAYQDDPFWATTDPVNKVDIYAAGNHLLKSITPTVYQHGAAIVRQPIVLSYSSSGLQDSYYDGENIGSSLFTHWHYLTQYQDLQTGIGGKISYQTAFNNSNGTPNASDGDNRYDPLYCSNHTDCTGNYNHPDSLAWSQQVVTSLTALGKDSSASTLALATTTYHYTLAVVGHNCPAAGSNTDCTSDVWAPIDGTTKDGDWKDFFHNEFRGFAAVFTTSPAGNLTVDHYFSTLGRFTQATSSGNYNSGQMFEEDVYAGNQEIDSKLLKRISNTYAGQGPHNACRTDLDQIFGACLVVVPTTRTTFYEGTGTANASAPWVQTDNTYDDYSTGSGLSTSTTVYHNLLQSVITSSNAPTLTKKWQYVTNDRTVNNVVYHSVNLVSHSEIDDSTGHIWNCVQTLYDEGRVSGIPAPAMGLATTRTSSSDCSNASTTALTSYTGYDALGNPATTVDAFGAANPGIYTAGKGCTLSSVPPVMSATWPATHYTTCTTYDRFGAQPISTQNALGQGTTTSYDYGQASLQISSSDVNEQTSTLAYSYDSNGARTIKLSQPGETGSFTSSSGESASCTRSSATPCYEIESAFSLYAGAVKRTFYDAQGREVETRTPLDTTHDTIVFTVYNDSSNSTFKSIPFRVASGSNWLDPNGATDDTGGVPGGTATFADALGRTLLTTDAIGNQTQTSYGLGTVNGDTSTYQIATTVDANGHVQITYTDALNTEKGASPDGKDTPVNEKTPRIRYTLTYDGRSGGSLTATAQKTVQYNALNQPVSVTVTDLVPQPGQVTTSTITTLVYDDLGRLTTLNDPDRGTHTYTYNANGKQITDVSGSRTIGTSYDLLGRAGCVQAAAPTTDGSGGCSGSLPLVQNSYDASRLGTQGTNDWAIGQLNQSVAYTYFPDGTSAVTTMQYMHDQRGHLMVQKQFVTDGAWNLTTPLPGYQLNQSFNDANQPTTSQFLKQSEVDGSWSTDTTYTLVYDSTTGQLSGISNTGTATANLATVGYDQHGQLSDINFLSSTGTPLANEHFTYDGNLRLAASAATWQSGSGSTGSIFSQSLTYDAVGNVLSKTTNLAAVSGQSNSGGGETENFCYDSQNRLVWGGNSGTQPAAGNGTCGSAGLINTLNGNSYNTSYTYTNLGQIFQQPLGGAGAEQQALFCDSTHPHELTGLYSLGTTCANRSNASYSASYDAFGNQVSRTYNGSTSALSYDGQDRLVQNDMGSAGKEQYVYDATGQRVLKRSTASSGTTTLTEYAFGLEEHVFDASGNNLSNACYYLLPISNSGGNERETDGAGYVQGTVSQNNRMLGIIAGNSTQFYLTDMLGSIVTAFSNVAGSAIVSGNQVFNPYGTRGYTTGNMGTARGFTGQYADSTGLDYYNARYYDPAIGAFITADIKEDNAHGYDPYGYVTGNPEEKNDPTGTTGCDSRCQAVHTLASSLAARIRDRAAFIQNLLENLSFGTGSGLSLGIGALLEAAKVFTSTPLIAGAIATVVVGAAVAATYNMLSQYHTALLQMAADFQNLATSSSVATWTSQDAATFMTNELARSAQYQQGMRIQDALITSIIPLTAITEAFIGAVDMVNSNDIWSTGIDMEAQLAECATPMCTIAK